MLKLKRNNHNGLARQRGYHKEPIWVQSEKRNILWSAGCVETKTIYRKKNKKKLITKHGDEYTFKFWNVSSLDLSLFLIDIKAVCRYLVLFIDV